MAKTFNSYLYPIIPVSGSTTYFGGQAVPSSEFDVASFYPDTNVLMFCPLAILNNTGANAQDLHLELYNNNGTQLQDYKLDKALVRQAHLWYNIATNLDGYTMYCDVINTTINPGSKIEYYNNGYLATFGDYYRLATVGRANTMETERLSSVTNDLSTQSKSEILVPNYNVVRNDRADDWTPIKFYRYPSLFAGATGPTSSSGITRSNVAVKQYVDYIGITLTTPLATPSEAADVFVYRNPQGNYVALRNTTELLISDQPADNQLLQVGMMMNSTAQSHQFYFHSNHDETSHFKDYNGTSYDCSDGDTLAVHSMVDYITYSTVDIAKPVLSTSDNGKNLIWSISNNPNVKNNVKYNVRRDGNKVNLTDIEATQWDITNNYGTHTWQIEVFPTSASIVRNEAFYSGSGETVPYLNKVFLQIPRVTVNNRLSNTITTYQTETPTITPINVTLPDEYEFSVSSTGATYYKYAIDNNALSGYIPIANRTKVSNLAYGNHTVTVFVYADNQGHGASTTTKSFSLTALFAPSGLSFSRTTVDGGIFTYTLLQNLPVNSYKFKISLNNGAWVDNSNNTSYNISGGVLGNNIVVVVLEYYNNGVHKSDFDSTASTTFELPKLITPQAIGLKNYNSNGGVSSIRMQWGAVQFAADYVVYSTRTHIDAETGLIVTDSPVSYDNADGLSVLISDINGTGNVKLGPSPGVYRFTVQAKASGIGDSLSQFDSNESTVGPNLEFEIHVLKAPVIAWKSASTGLLSQESTLMWATPTDPDDENNIPDYYFVNMNAAVDGTRLLFGTIPNDTENGMEYNIVDNLLPNPTSTYSYVINVIPNSYNTLYYQPTDTSISNNLEYSVIKLATPTNIAYDIDHQTISWDNITNANIYYVYEINENNLSILWGTSDTNSFEFDTPLDAGLHYFYVVAGRISYEED